MVRHVLWLAAEEQHMLYRDLWSLVFQIRVVNAFRSVIDGRSQRAIASPAVFNSLLAPVRTAMIYDDEDYPPMIESADVDDGSEKPRYASVESQPFY